MGDRVLIVAHAGDKDIAPAIYGHWYGCDAPRLLKEAGEVGIIRKDDAPYTAARICGYFHEQSPRRATGLGIVAPPADLTDETLTEYSHGDAGVVLVDVRDGSLRYVGGYLSEPEDAPDPEVETVTAIKLAA